MIEPIQDTLSPAFVYRYEMDALVVKMDTLETTNSILVWAIVFIILVAGSTCFYILRSAKMRVKNEQLANKLLSKQAAAMPNFIDRVNDEFKFSTRVQPQVCAPLIDCEKIEIVKIGLGENVPFELLNSCYNGTETHCGECESCVRLKRALIANGANDYIEKLFKG